MTKNITKIGLKQAGYTLIELMIAAVLGLLLIAGAIQLFLGSNRSFSLQSGLSDIQEDGKFALLFLQDQIQKASWYEDDFGSAPPPIDFTNSSDGLTDSITFSYLAATNGTDNRDCNGALVASGRIINQLYVGGDEELMCLGNGAGAVAQPLVNGVKGFQVLYGVETDTVCPDGAVNNYLTRDEVVAAGYTVEGNTKYIVASVRFALLIGSEDNVVDSKTAQEHWLLDTKVNTDTRLAYRTFQQTIFIPTALYSRISESTLGCAS